MEAPECLSKVSITVPSTAQRIDARPDGCRVPPRPAVRRALDHGVVSTSDWIQVVIASITGAATLAALANVLITRANERRRTQPIVIAHEAGSRRFARDSETGASWVVDSYLTSEGGGPAFNVRFGVEFAGVRYAYRLDAGDSPLGNLQRVLPAGQRRPEAGDWPILIPSLGLWGRAADTLNQGRPGALDAERVYWAVYENAEGQTWETRNPGDRSTRLDIRRVRRPREHEREQLATYEDAAQRDDKWVNEALADLERQRRGTVAAVEARGRSKGDPPGPNSPKT